MDEVNLVCIRKKSFTGTSDQSSGISVVSPSGVTIQFAPDELLLS
jgi:hypothetical protein